MLLGVFNPGKMVERIQALKEYLMPFQMMDYNVLMLDVLRTPQMLMDDSFEMMVLHIKRRYRTALAQLNEYLILNPDNNNN